MRGRNWGIDKRYVMGGLSVTDPERYRKINAVLTEKSRKKDLLDVVETVSLDHVSDFANNGRTAENIINLIELKTEVSKILAKLSPREDRILRKRFGIGLNTDHTQAECAKEFSITTSRVQSIEAAALRKLRKHSRNLA